MRTPCVEKGCYENVFQKGRCKEHFELNAWKGSTRKERLPDDWATRRRLIFQKYGTVCHICGEEGSDSIDHVIPGDDHSFENLRPAHNNVPNSFGVFCHRIKTAYEGVEARRNQGWY